MNSYTEAQPMFGAMPPQPVPEPSPMRPSAAFAADPYCKSPFLATVLSFMPGLGQVYLGYYRQGFVNFTVVASLIGILNVDALDHTAIFPFLGMFLGFFWMFNLVDAYRRAVFVNRMMYRTESYENPEVYKNASREGNLASGVLLILIGAIGLARTLFDISLDWLRDWWPLIIVGFGAYLVSRALWELRHPRA